MSNHIVMPGRALGKLTRWMGEFAPGRWRTFWKGNVVPQWCGARECHRRRLRILAGKVHRDEIYRSDYLTAIAEAQAAEYPLTSRKAA